jgi:DNA-binding beta-propeller fold protein YncE
MGGGDVQATAKTKRAIAKPALAFICLLAPLACAGQASAARGHEFTGVFGTKCIAAPCVEGELEKPAGVAVNEASGDVYVVDEGAGRVVRFASNGEFVSEFDGSGLLAKEETEAGGLGREGEEKTGRFEKPQTIAVDNSCAVRRAADPTLAQATCEAEDPSNEDVYVVDAGHRVVDKYSAEGKYLGQITKAGEIAFSARALDGVAVDPTGKVWVYREEPAQLDGFDNKTPNEFLAPEISLKTPNGEARPGLAIDSNGDFYAMLATPRGGAGGFFLRAGKFDHSGEPIIAELDEQEASGLAVEQSPSANSFIDNLTSVGVFDAEGGEVERLGEEHEAKHLSEGAGVGVDVSRGVLYVADASAGQLVVFGQAPASTPKIEGESFSNVSSDSATLTAQINPRSVPGEAASEWHFQYGRCTSASSCQTSAYESEVPKPFGQLPADFETHPLSVRLTGLEPGASYHFRALAKNAHGEGEAGQEEIFTTETSGGPLVLPDDRGWELVTPPDKQGALIAPIEETGVVQAAADGSAITYQANSATEAEPQGGSNQLQILSRRGDASWATRDIAIAHSASTGLAVGPGPGSEYRFFDQALTLSAVNPIGPFDSALSAAASESTAYLHDLGESCGSACYEPLVTRANDTASPFVPFGEREKCEPHPEQSEGSAGVECGPQFLGATLDLSHIVLQANAPLAPGGVAGELYEWAGGRISPVSVLPGAERLQTSAQLGFGSGGATSASAQGAISSDGTRISFTAQGNLYLRDMARGETLQLDESEQIAGEPCAGCASGGGEFQFASSDGSRVLFTDQNKLTEDAGAQAGKPDLYQCLLVASGEGQLGCRLSDLTAMHEGESASVQGGVLGASEDGSYVYFVAEGILSGAENVRKEKALAGEPNLYLAHNGTSEFVTTLSPGDAHDWASNERKLRGQPTRVSPNGQWLELMSQGSPTGYDNRDAATGAPVAEVYLYDATSKQLSCASCMPTGVRPVGVEYHGLEPGSGGLVGGPREIWSNSLVAANVPGWTAMGPPFRSRYQDRYLSDQGRLFFNSADGLVPQDANATEDVYEYEPPGVGSCSEAAESFSAASGGCTSLISSGRSSQESAFLDASESGDDVFFLTSERLSAIDTDNAPDVYDAHVCSESPCIAYPPAPGAPCDESTCRPLPTAQPSIFGAPASATFQGPGNQAPAPSPPAAAAKKTAAQIRAEHLKKALKACRAKQKKRKRHACEKQARKRYAPAKAHKAKRRGAAR